jgi:hypothetical protein
MAAGNLFLPSFVEHFNERFALPAQKTENLHRALHVKATQLTDILCHREQRHVSQQLTMAYDRKQIILERSEISEKLAGQYVEIYDFADRPLEVRWKGHLLPYRVFDKDQRVSHTAVVENKRLGHALATVKAQQDIKHVPKVMTNSAKHGYKKNPRRLYGPDYKPKIAAAPAVEMTATHYDDNLALQKQRRLALRQHTHEFTSRHLEKNRSSSVVPKIGVQGRIQDTAATYRNGFSQAKLGCKFLCNRKNISASATKPTPNRSTACEGRRIANAELLRGLVSRCGGFCNHTQTLL